VFQKISGKAIFILFVNIVSILSVRAQINFPTQSHYHYLKGSKAGGISGTWVNHDFDDSSWSLGNAPFRYGDGTGGTVFSDMQNNYTTIYLRTTFEASNIADLVNLKFTIDYDDGFAIWINGTLVLSKNAPSLFSSSSTATGLHESGIPETFTLSSNEIPLLEGTNTMAVLELNENSGSSDIYFDISILAEIIFSDTIGLTFSHPSGFYSSPFTLLINSSDPEVEILYTLDGSNPQYSATSYSGGSSLAVNIDPASTTGRSATPAVVLRVASTKNGYLPSFPVGKTFIFTDNVINQTYPGGEWPSSSINGQVIDYSMDPDVTQDPRYTDLIDDALLEIPSISISTELENLFDPSSGIIVNAGGRGIEWERECSAELICPDGQEGFQINAGLRIRGGASRNNGNPKHSFRLFFREEYGDDKLNYPLFGDEGASKFYKIDLRTAQNYAWNNDGDRNDLNTFVRDIFSRDAQRGMGWPYARGRYYHLYLNGMYWGLFQTQERTEGHFAETYLGDDNEDYDVVKVSPTEWPYFNEVTDGNFDAWTEVWDMCQNGFYAPEDYFKLEGKNASGNPVKGSKVLVDIDNLIDYMILIIYSGNYDAPVSTFADNKMPNNYYGIYNRKDNSKGFIFCAHDSEHSLMIEPVYVGEGLYENRVNLANRNDWRQMVMPGFSYFNPQWLHYKLSNVKEYRVRFADRAYQYLTNNGILTPDRVYNLILDRAYEFDMAIIAESARWGDTKESTPRTKDDDWWPAINDILTDYVPYRTDIVIDQLLEYYLFPQLDAPIIKNSNTIISGSYFNFDEGFTITIENPGSNGSIYYSLDGSDPRSLGGTVAEGTISSKEIINLAINTSTIIKARIKNGTLWSALREINFLNEDEDFSNLKVTEIHYHPEDVIAGSDTISGKSFEFIEFKNIGETALNLSGLVIDSAIYCEFPPNSILGPYEFYVAASKPTQFYNMYGKVASANFSGNLGNSGEEIVLFNAQGTEIMRFTYDDHSPWPEEPDGNGPSMVSVEFNPIGNPGDPYYWRTSLRNSGSPFENDIPLPVIDTPFEESNSSITFSVYPNPTNGNLDIRTVGQLNSSEPLNIRLYDISGTLLYASTEDFETSIDLNELGAQPGLYILHIETGDTVETHKIVFNPF
jgi:hypothetical protein